MEDVNQSEQPNDQHSHDSLQEYQGFIDGLLGWPVQSVTARWVREWDQVGPKTYTVPEEFNRNMAMFTPEQRHLVAQMLQDEHEAGVFQALCYLESYTLSRNGIELPHEPFGYTRFEDFVHHQAGGTWKDLAIQNEVP